MINKQAFKNIVNKINSNYHKYFGYVNPKKRLITFFSIFLSLAALLVTTQVVKQRVFYKSEASENQITPIIIPGSLLDTGIRAENFTDVDHNLWSWKYIQQIAPLNIIVPPPTTPTEFNPQGLVLRSNMAQFLLKTYKLITNQDPPIVGTPFTDIQTLPQEVQDAIAKIYGLKITAGVSATEFAPEQPVNRAQMVTFFMNFYRLLSGNYPPENEVPFTDIYDPDLAWSVKYIKMAYNLKITAGTSETTFSPRDNVTREQMAAFIFNFMRLFGPSWNNPNLASELASLHSTTYYPSPASVQELNSWLSEIKQTGFNALWFVSSWKDFNPRPLANPSVYNDSTFLKLTQILDLLRQNNMKAILPLNYIGPPAPEGIDVCRWAIDLTAYQAFETYVNEFLRRIESYSDMVYILFFSEGAEPCVLNIYNDAKQIASLLRPTLGSLPQRIDSRLRSKFKIGYHDFTLINHNWANGESPIQMPLSYDFLSFATYDQEAKTDQEIIDTLNFHSNNFNKLYPFTSAIVGEFGALPCNDVNNSSRENQARVLKVGIQHLLTKNLGFNVWQWEGKYYQNGDVCKKFSTNTGGVVTPDSLGLVYRDKYQQFISPVVNKPARLEIMKLLNPSAPAPQCVEQDAPVFGQKIVDEHHKYCHSFSSSCVPEGWSVLENVTDCSQICTGESIWLRNPSIWDGECADNNPYPSDCIPIATEPYDPSRVWEQYSIDNTCRPQISPVPTSTPSPIPSTSSSFSTPPTSTPFFTFSPLPSAQPTYSPEITPTTEVTETTTSVTENYSNVIINFYNSILDFIAELLNL